jgi:hypothetical protein
MHIILVHENIICTNNIGNHLKPKKPKLDIYDNSDIYQLTLPLNVHRTDQPNI